jgi:hypothetical protein
MLKLKELAEELRQRTWTVDCPEMKLGRPGTPGPTEYIGPGYLRQEADGTITYKLYPPPPAKFDPRSTFPKMGAAGNILGDDFFYRLDAMDKGGTVWRVERTLPTPDTSFVGGRQFRLVTGVAHELVTTREQAQSVSSLKMMFFTEVRVPGNASTEVTTVTPDGSVNRFSKLDTAQFKTAFGDFHIYNRPGMLVVEVVSPTPFPMHFETQIVESLGFVLAKPLTWNVLELVENGVEIVRLRGAQEVVDAKLQPPIVSGTVDMSGGDVWRLFDKYLAMVCIHTDPDFHSCSRHVFSVLEASAGAISARGLALGVAVEGLAKALFPDAVALSATLKPVVRRLRAYFRAWPEFEDEQTKKAIYDRVEAMLGRILDVSAKSRLYALAQEKAVYEAHIKAWSDLRNASAHGVTPELDDIQRLVDLCDGTMVLMYHLVFRAVGYEGSYRDYSVQGWPKKYYRGRPPTQEEIAIAAYYLWKKAGEQHDHDVEHWFAAKDELERGAY